MVFCASRSDSDLSEREAGWWCFVPHTATVTCLVSEGGWLVVCCASHSDNDLSVREAGWWCFVPHTATVTCQ